ncbi:hypothetical protein SKAU_G00049940 [Synaphobranchus kaupii]|uniref:Uncharacterized protein n=1 Tax=Synaphobranchus kaupii TaxID=118154 RepID=A0A9Q1J7H6_SYNKA|nr:hypothetical protein SKAU_G00049940 [Synaphobranchus kaupii]
MVETATLKVVGNGVGIQFSCLKLTTHCSSLVSSPKGKCVLQASITATVTASVSLIGTWHRALTSASQGGATRTANINRQRETLD